MISEHVEVLRHMKETIKAIMPSEVAALDAAIASLSAGEKAEAGGGEVVAWDNGSPCMESRPIGMVYPAKPAPRASGYLDSSGVEWNAYDTGQMEAYARAAYSDGWAACLRAARESAPPSAPVGVERLVAEWRDKSRRLRQYHGCDALSDELEGCAQELEAVLAPQPAAVDEVKCPWDGGSPCVEPRPIGMVYPMKPAPRASGYLDGSGVEWNAWDAEQMEAYARAAYSDGWEAGYRSALAQQPAAVGDTRRLEYLIDNELLVRRLSDTGLWMVTTGDLTPAIDGSEYDTWREAIDDALAAQQGGES